MILRLKFITKYPMLPLAPPLNTSSTKNHLDPLNSPQLQLQSLSLWLPFIAIATSYAQIFFKFGSKPL